jgi:hypothetical protein
MCRDSAVVRYLSCGDPVDRNRARPAQSLPRRIRLRHLNRALGHHETIISYGPSQWYTGLAMSPLRGLVVRPERFLRSLFRLGEGRRRQYPSTVAYPFARSARSPAPVWIHRERPPRREAKERANLRLRLSISGQVPTAALPVSSSRTLRRAWWVPKDRSEASRRLITQFSPVGKGRGIPVAGTDCGARGVGRSMFLEAFRRRVSVEGDEAFP